MTLFINTAQSDRATVGLIQGRAFLIKKTFNSKFRESEKLLPEIDNLLKKTRCQLADLTGLIVVNGPGGFSSLRLGISVANALSYALKIPATGVKLAELFNPSKLAKIGDGRLRQIKTQKLVEPFYGQEPNITKSNQAIK